MTSTSMIMNKALQRWQILASVIKKQGRETENSKISVRRFSGFNLFSKEICESENDYQWLDYRLERGLAESVTLLDDKPMFLRQRSRQVSIEDLTGFDNTGNVCLWPSEEVLTYYLLKHKDTLNGKAVCELGAGMTGLAGIFSASFADPSKVLLTDGNKDCVENMEAIICRNKPSLGSTIVTSRCLVWDEQANLVDLESEFDFLISADCLFFTQCHSGLVYVMDTILKHSGLAIVMAPRRKDTLELFCSKAKSRFNVVKLENYDSLIWLRHQQAENEDPLYDADIHYPVLLLLTKKQ